MLFLGIQDIASQFQIDFGYLVILLEMKQSSSIFVEMQNLSNEKTNALGYEEFFINCLYLGL